MSAYILVLKHQTYVNLCIFTYFDTKLRVVKPFIIALGVQILVFKSLFRLVSFFLGDSRTATSVSLGSPLTLNRVDFPVF